ncbi:hypothetical protein OIU85_012976 [Salix viminalis]|uniref:Pectate lyase superfamily protein domain-containing protein n=1 Tax=Salix viminalis TaxID=40686 RepID=A0A9Q0NQI6_SALVM|nr:hypothetical protein OIU85_012976 [Salix viminalis]
MQDVYLSFLILCIAASGFGFGHGQKVLNVVDFGAIGDGQTDDTNAFLSAWKALCGDDGANQGSPSLQIPEGKTFLLQPVKFQGPCKSVSVQVQVQGKIIAPSTIEEWKNCEADCWIGFVGVANLNIYGSGLLDGQGSDWWMRTVQANNLNAREIACNPPSTALNFERCDDLQLSGLTHVDSPKGHIGINDCNGVLISNLNIAAPENSPNTDGIDVARSTNVHIQDSTIGTGDDCVAINGGCSYINITNIACGPGHGISVGSLGKDGQYDTVEEVHVRNCSFTGTQNAARIKTWPGGSGYVRKISYEKITLVASKNPIIIDQHYCDGVRNCRNSSTALQVSDVTYSSFHGTSVDEEAIRLDCSGRGCINIVMDNINITSADPGKTTYAYCEHTSGTSWFTAPNVPCLSVSGF